MKRQFKLGALFLLTASLFYGFAARAQGVVQEERVSYALSLIDAGDGTGNTQTGGPVTDATTLVRLKVTVSVPRTSNRHGAIPVYASPSRVMFRKHRGPSTAFDGSLTLTRDAPYTAAGTPATSAYYPMPQADDQGVSILEPTHLNLTAVSDTTTVNYIGVGMAHNPARWEATYLTAPISVTDALKTSTADPALQMVGSLLRGEATYEWFIASRYGLGSVARISDIQDHGRKMSFQDVRLWTPQGAASTNLDSTSQMLMGKYDTYILASMPMISKNTAIADSEKYGSWQIYNGAIGSSQNGDAGLHLLSVARTKTDYSDAARVESPVYPDGVSSIIFKARTFMNEDEVPAELLVQAWENDAWVDVETITLTADFKTYTVNFNNLPENAEARFRIVRLNEAYTVSDVANGLTYIIRDLLVRSAKPEATFSALGVDLADQSDDSAEPHAGSAFTTKISVNPVSDTTKTPRGYEGAFRFRRRAAGDSARAWYEVPATVVKSEGSAYATLTANFTPGVLITNADGTVNVRENAFFTDVNGRLTGMLAGVYDVEVDCGVYGSFEAGRENIDGFETIRQTLDGYDTQDPANPLQSIHHPYLLNVREQPAVAESVFLRVTYRTGTSEKNYDLNYFNAQLLPSSKAKNTWRVDLEKKLRHEEPTAVYAWGDEREEDDQTSTDPTDDICEAGFISFKICAVDKEGTETWYGQNLQVSTSSLRPNAVEVVPSVTETFVKAESEAATVPVVVAVDTIPNAHLMVELDFTNPDAPVAHLAGSFKQDFNTWDPSERFVETEFRENVTSATADFDCTPGVSGLGEINGWIPDEGPLANTTSFIEKLLTGRLKQAGEFAFILREDAYVTETKAFASWGASPDEAEPDWLRAEGDMGSDYSDYLKMGANTEVLLRRRYTYEGGIYRPDALFRLRGGGGTLAPRDDGNVSINLNGVGKLSFKLSASLPYDLGSIAELVSADGESLNITGRGLSAGVEFTNLQQDCAPSGYSVSYYLIDYTNPRQLVYYELRVSQVMRFDDDTTKVPRDVVVMELYKWTGGKPTRQSLTLTNNGTKASFYEAGKTLVNTTYGLWVRADGRIALGQRGGSGSGALNTVAYSSDSLTDATKQFWMALGSAECRPLFSQVNSTSQAGDNTNAEKVFTQLSPDEVEIFIAGTNADRPAWTKRASNGRLQVQRITPNADQICSVTVTAKSRTNEKFKVEKVFATSKMDQTFEMTIGMTDAEVTIIPSNDESNVLIDDISFTSWRGNDGARNGTENVPVHTDLGFSPTTGFSGVGLWIRPEDESQLNVLPERYTGKQVLLMQRSRQNNDEGFKETETEGRTGVIKHTGSALALYLPYSAEGYGPVSFRYRIPAADEFGKQNKMPPVRVMLQFVDGGPYNTFLSATGGPKDYQWENVSDPVELRNTNGEWALTTILPRFWDGKEFKELVATKGTMRLVMVISQDMTDQDDPYVYLDDVRVTDNKEGSSASWTAKNVRVSSTPVNNLYWKDRLATDGATPPETEDSSFAEKSSLTRGMELNNVTNGIDTEGTYSTTVLESPVLPEGAGLVTFAARLTSPQSQPVRLYLNATTDDSDDMIGLKPITYVDVTNTVYTTYEIDLSKYKHYYTMPNDNGTPGTGDTGHPFNCAEVRRLTLRAFVNGDGATDDGFGKKPSYGRVLIDQVAIANPVLPSIRVASVAFSNMPGNNVPTEFDARSPLSQPVQGASLRTMVHLDRAQLLKTDSIRVFLTVNPHSVDPNASGSLLRTFTNEYSYTDVLGGEVSAESDHPIYTWDQTNLERWPLSAWFDETAIQQKLNDPAFDPAVGDFGLEKTIELKRPAGADTLNYYADLAPLSLGELPANSLVRYNAWVVYQSAESNQWFYAQIRPVDYTEFPWYFPRSLNAELREKASTENNPKTTAFFSPYFWVYAYLPGEAFINEFNLADNTNSAVVTSTQQFVEICAPANTNLGGWRVELTGRNALENIANHSISIAPDAADVTAETSKTILSPDMGAVPYQRKVATSAARGFYTAISEYNKVYYRDAAGTPQTQLKKTKNGGVVQQDVDRMSIGSGAQAASIRLHRPTGGAEHIVCFTLNTETNLNSSDSASFKNLDSIYTKYRDGYAQAGFGGEWFQTFTTGTWEDFVADTNPDAFGNKENLPAKMHARRLVKADKFIADPANDNRFATTATGAAYVTDIATATFANSIATVDMGGIFVTRKNAINEDVDNGPLDLTDVMTGTWPATINPTVQTRITEPGDGTGAPVVQVTPCQINPDQYLVLYSGIGAGSVMSELEGHFGSHTLERFGTDANGEVSLGVNAAGRVSPQTWVLSQEVTKTKLTYTAFPFHLVKSVTFRLKDAEDASKVITDLDELKAAIVEIAGGAIDEATFTPEGWITVVPTAGAAEVSVTTLTLKPNTLEEKRYSVEAKALFEIDQTGGKAREVITNVRPYCGEGSADFPLSDTAKYQPWWGSNFGFKVDYNTQDLDGSAMLSGVIVTYPSPTANAQSAWTVQDATWTGAKAVEYTDPVTSAQVTTKTLEGMEYTEAKALLNEVLVPTPTVGTRYVELRSGELNADGSGFYADASAVAVLSDAYAKEAGYDGTAATANKKEPAIPFCVWGVYTVTVQTANGNEKVSFLMRQAMPGETAAPVWQVPAWYAPAKVDGAALPYFYLYSTPPEAAWLSEVNVYQATGDEAPFAEVTFPVLREGITNASVPAAEPSGWTVRRYNDAGVNTETVDVATGTQTPSGALSYAYYTVDIDQVDAEDPIAYVLHRPCGAAEGGVWTAVTQNGGVRIEPTLQDAWLVAPSAYVVPGVSDATDVAGSVQLVGQTLFRELGSTGHKMECISSAVADRKEWAFAETTKGTDNNDLPPDNKPVWNQVTVTSTLRNAVYAGTTCGYQLVPGAFDVEGTPGETDPISLTLGGAEWVYNETLDGFILSYRPRTGYYFESITLPAELIGKVMLVGNPGALTRETILNRATDLKNKAETDPALKTTEWLTLEGRATVEMQQGEPTGRILFNADYSEGVNQEGEPITFADRDNYVISLLIMEEPISAQNSIEVTFTQGEVKVGAWMITQTLYALTDDGTGVLMPDSTKGGDTTLKPIWSDENGNKDGKYANRHGWIYQPLVGDKVGMSAVINPDLGLQGGRLGDATELLTADTPSVRPFLVWTAIPKSKVPTNLFDTSLTNNGMPRNEFISQWGLNAWLGSPSVQDGVTLSLDTLRRNLKKGSALYSNAGIIPMTYVGYCDVNSDLQAGAIKDENRAADTLLAFRTVTADELATAKLNSATTGISDELPDADNPRLDYTSEIDMTDELVWQDGAVLRFAVVIADAASGTVYDCQSISNFSSEAMEVYCPWYIPDAQTNINRATSAADAGGGVSPFAWIYSIPQGGVWINEIRPFALPAGDKRVASAFELAMYASPLKEDVSDPANPPKTFTPTRSLDGWKVITRYAPMPTMNADPATPIEWTTHKEVPLHSWVPYRRIVMPGYQGSYDLDYYMATVDPVKDQTVDFDSTVSILTDAYRSASYTYTDGTVNPKFQWLNFDLTDKEAGKDADLFNAGLEETLLEEGGYNNGVLYSIALVRNNGAVEDAVLFYNQMPKHYGEEYTYYAKCVNVAVESELLNKTTVGMVRAYAKRPLRSSGEAYTAQFLKFTNVYGTSSLLWEVISNDDGRMYSTLSAQNKWEVPGGEQSGYSYKQPYLEYAAQDAHFATIGATLTGGGSEAKLKLAAAAGTEVDEGTSVSVKVPMGADYQLDLENLNEEWYALNKATRNGSDFVPKYTPATTYAFNAATQTYATSASLLIDKDIVTEDLFYNLTYSYTEKALALSARGELASKDPGFIAWLEQVSPEAVAGLSDTEGTTASERYWLGATTPDEVVDPALAFTHIGMYYDLTQPDVEAPLVKVLLSKAGNPDRERITDLNGDGCVVLLGKKSLEDAEWDFIMKLEDGVDGDLLETSEIIISGKDEYKFFRAALWSVDQLPVTTVTP